MAGPEAVGQGHGLRAAQRQGTARTGGNAAVQALGIAQGDKGAAGGPAMEGGGLQEDVRLFHNLNLKLRLGEPFSNQGKGAGLIFK